MPGGTLGTIRGTIAIDYDGAGIIKAKKDVEDVKQKGISTQQSLDRTGRVAGLAGAAIAGGFALAVTAAVKFDQRMSAIQAVSGATGGQLDQLRAKALKLGADTAFSASDAASAMEELVKAGLSVSDVLNGAADATVALAAAGGVALPEAATISANAMNQFNLAAADLPKIADLIAGAANASAIDVSEFGMAMQQAGAVAHLAGLSFDDMAVAIAEMGNAGIKGSDAGTSLKTFLQNLIPTTKQQIELSKQLGLITRDGGNAFFDASGKVKSLADISQVLQNALRGQTKEQQLATLQTLFGSDAIRAAAVLANNGAAGFNNLAAAMGQTSAADVAKTRMGNLAGQFEQLKGSTETLAIQIGSKLIPFLNDLVTKLTSLANWFTSLSSTQQSWTLGIIGTVGSLLLMASALIRLVAFFRALQVALGVIKALTIWTKIAAVATKIWAAAQWLLNVAMDANPIGLIILAIVALAAGIFFLWTHSAAFRNFFIGLWNDIWGFLKVIGAWFAGPFANFFISVWGVIVTAFNAIKGVVMGVFNFIVAGVLAWWGIISSVLNFFAPLFNAVFNLIAAIVRTAFNIITAIFAVFNTVAIGPLVAAFQFLWNAAVAYFGLIRSIITAVFNFLAPYIIGIWNGIVSFLSAVWNGIVGVATFLWNALIAYLSFVWNTISSIIHTGAGWISGFLSGIWNAVSGTVSRVWNDIRNIIAGVWNAIVSVIQSAVARVTAIINGISAIVSSVGRFFGQLRSAAEGGAGSLFSFVATIPGRILGALGNLAGTLFNAGRNIIQGLIDGIASLAGRVADAVKNVVQKARDLLPFSPAKTGPFSGRGWSLYSGQAIVTDMARGIDSRSNTLAATMDRMLAGVVTPINVPVSTGVSGGSTAPVVVSAGGPNINQTFNVPNPMSPAQVATYSARRLMLGLSSGVTSG